MNKHSFRKSALVVTLGCTLFASSVMSEAATPEVDEDCPIPAWRAERAKRDAAVMMAASEAAQPTSNRTPGEKSCLSMFQDFGASASNRIPTTLGGIIDAIVDAIKDYACNAAEQWLRHSIRDMNQRLQGELKDVPFVSGKIGTDGAEVDFDFDVISPIEDAVKDETGLDVNFPTDDGEHNYDAARPVLPTHILGNL